MPETKASKVEAMFQRLLLGIDDSTAGEISTSFATAVARQHASSVLVLYVNPYVLGGRGTTVLSSKEAEQLVDRAVDELRANGVEASGTVRRATCFDVAGRIVETAGEWSADAIVVGSHRHRRLRRLFGQGVRERIVKLSALPVLTAPAPLKVGIGVRPPALPGPLPSRSPAEP
jgi:nucleotide-binding universal stress UspA family protein